MKVPIFFAIGVVIGPTGRNFAAGMSGGVAYVLDEADDFQQRCNPEMVDLEAVEATEDLTELREMLSKHARYTQSTIAERILDHWEDKRSKFVKVMPKDYKRILAAIEKARQTGIPEEEAVMEAAHG